MKTRLVIAAMIAVCINILFFVAYFVFSLRMRQYAMGEFSYEALITSFKVSSLVIGSVASIIMVAFFWIASSLILRDTKRLSYEMKQIVGGNLDVEIQEASYDIFRQMSTELAQVRVTMKDAQEQLSSQVQEKTKALTKKIADLEKMQDLTTDTILLAKKMEQERDQLLVQIHGLQDKRKKT